MSEKVRQALAEAVRRAEEQIRKTREAIERARAAEALTQTGRQGETGR